MYTGTAQAGHTAGTGTRHRNGPGKCRGQRIGAARAAQWSVLVEIRGRGVGGSKPDIPHPQSHSHKPKSPSPCGPTPSRYRSHSLALTIAPQSHSPAGPKSQCNSHPRSRGPPPSPNSCPTPPTNCISGSRNPTAAQRTRRTHAPRCPCTASAMVCVAHTRGPWACRPAPRGRGGSAREPSYACQ